MLIYVTNRKLCQYDFLDQIERLAKGKPHGMMLREKDLNLPDYEKLAVEVKEICHEHHVPLIINQNMSVAMNLKIPNIQLSMTNLRKYHQDLHAFKNIGASVHTIDEAKEAQVLGATYLIAGHIFSTDSKKGVPPRGLPFLKNVSEAVPLPVLAIGGITRYHVNDIYATGAKGVCIMSEAMTSQHPTELAYSFKL
ncbi:thiamine phosphate synthase [Niallia sp. XMNu-256]|uniref:thiamine phosphate synthase n=1 Tax=Niallia sp. XMNu-256 TaxID=3082444 RepID=UPI0030CCAFC9